MPLAVDNSVSAFAAYKGLAGNLSKKQRRRRSRQKKNQASEVSTDTVKPASSAVHENVKKRKNTEGKKNDMQKQKKRKFNDLAVDKGQDQINGVKSKLESSKHKIMKFDGKNKLPSSEPGKFVKRVKSEKQTRSGKRKQIEKEVGGVLAKKNKIYKNLKNVNNDFELFSQEQIKKKIFSEIENNTDNQLANKSVVYKKNKLKPSDKIITDNVYLENQAVQSKVNEPSLDKDLAEIYGHPDNGPTLISKIKQLKRDLASKDVTKLEKPTYKQFVTYQNMAVEKLKSSTDEGKKIFQDIISPCDVSVFFRDHWEKTPLYVPAPNPEKFKNLISTQLIDAYLRENVVMFGKHIDITSYKDGKRETHNPEGRALPHVVWDLYTHKCSVRLLCPQAAFNNIFAMNSKLQEFFGCFVGANAYLTPPNSQGFAPHYDDIEAFVLQIEGQKKWKIYNPRTTHEALPRYSSRNFSPSELNEPTMEVTLRPGDMLYFPRGFIHQAECSKETHSLHITVSMYQKNSWIDLLEKAVPLALSKAAKDDIEFRRGLPINYLKCAGLAYKSHALRKAFIKSVKEKMVKLIKHLDIDKAVDTMGAQFITDALPPVFSQDEASRCVLGNGLRMEDNGKVKGSIAFTASTKVRFSTALCHRLIRGMITREDGQVDEEIRLYYSNDNSLEYHGEEAQFLVIPEEYVPAIRLLSLRYPNFIAIKSLPLPSLDEQARLVGDLWDRGILMTEKPLEEFDVVQSSSEQEEDEENTSEKVDKKLNILKENKKKKKIVKGKSKKKIDKDNADEENEEEEEDEEAVSNKENNKSFRAYDKANTNNGKFINANDDIEEVEKEADDDDEEEIDDDDEDEESEEEDEEEAASDKENDKSFRAYDRAITDNEKFIIANDDIEEIEEEETDDDIDEEEEVEEEVDDDDDDINVEEEEVDDDDDIDEEEEEEVVVDDEDDDIEEEEEEEVDDDDDDEDIGEEENIDEDI